MIYVFQDGNKIPQEWLDKVAGLQVQLEALGTVEERKAFIKAKSAVWGEIREQLLAMSHGKCWYSEAPDAVSDWHVDHFRPKNRALDEDKTEHPGYAWLAFDWKNYRIAGSYPNAPHKDEEGTTRGKWDFFPLAPGSVRATWDNRDSSHEMCLILDPAKKDEPKWMTFDEKGLPMPSNPNIAIIKRKVAVTVHFLYLDSPRLVSARKRVWRETLRWIDALRRAAPDDINACTPLDYDRLTGHIEQLGNLTAPDAPFSATARACLRANNLAEFIKMPEEALAA